jgi:Carboxypeptidase regulatory-like domain
MYRFSTPQLPPVEGRKPARGAIFFAGLLLAVLFFYLPAFAQNATGSLSGTVTDASGAIIPGAKVELKNEATQVSRETITNGSGFFSFAAVQPASYTVTITAAGFTTWQETSLAFTQAASLTTNATLKISSSSTQVEVISAAEIPVPTDNGASSTTLNSHMINELSIQGRDAAELIKIMPGMGMNTGLTNSQWSSLVTQSNNGPIGQFSSNGTQPNGGMTMTSDGANLLDPGNQGTQTSNINQNQIAEMTILTSAYGAEFAKGPTTFQAIGKSGGSQFHGGGYFYARNGVFNSNFSQNNAIGVKAAQDSYYYPGGDIGGPVIIPKVNFNRNHDKLFFYAAYEYMAQNPATVAQQHFIETPQMMAGNFSPAYLASLGHGFNTGQYSGNFNVSPANWPGGMIPASVLDPNSLAYWKTFPAANTDPTSNANGNNYTFSPVLPVNRWEVRLRGDYNISDKTKLSFTWNRQDETDLNPISIWWGTGHDLPYPSSMPANQVSNIYSANLTHTFTPTLTNEFVFADATFINPISLSNPSAVNPSKVGFNMTGLFKDAYAPQIPNMLSWGAAPGYFAPTFGQQWQGGDFGKLSQTPSISDNVTKVAGTHTLKFGFYWDYARNQQTGSNFQVPPQGTAEFESYAPTTTNNALANFAAAYVTGFSQSNGTPVADVKYHEVGFFAQDQWKATRRLTLTLGIRFDHYGSWYPTSGPGFAVWNPALYNNTSSAGAWTGLTWNAINKNIPISGFPSKALWPEPRVGAAYDLFGDGKTVLRGGFGLYRYQLSNNNVTGDDLNAPLGYQSNSTTWGCCVGWNSFNQFSPSLGPAGLGSAPAGVLTYGDDKTPYTWSYNFTITQRVPWNSVVEMQYSGNRSRDLLLDSALSNQNLIPAGAFFKPDPITGVINDPWGSSFPTNDYYPLHNYTGMTLIGHGSYQNYNAAIVSWQKQTGQVTFTVNYTFSKVLGIRDGQTSNGGGNGTVTDVYNLAQNYGVLNYDHTHIFNSAYVINLPSPIKGNKFAKGAINGWELSGITQLQSGAPIQGNTNGNLNVAYGCVNHQNADGTISCIGISNQNQLGSNAPPLMPSLICDPRSGLHSGQYFNPSCFAPPAAGTQGNYVWPYIHGPAYFNSDLSLFKNFNITERQRLQFRFEAFNFLNHPLPQFGAEGNGDLTLKFQGTGGILTQQNTNQVTNGYPTYTVGRRVIEFAVKYNF